MSYMLVQWLCVCFVSSWRQWCVCSVFASAAVMGGGKCSENKIRMSTLSEYYENPAFLSFWPQLSMSCNLKRLHNSQLRPFMLLCSFWFCTYSLFYMKYYTETCPALNINTALLLSSKLGAGTQYDWANVTCDAKLNFICAVKPNTNGKLMSWLTTRWSSEKSLSTAAKKV